MKNIAVGYAELSNYSSCIALAEKCGESEGFGDELIEHMAYANAVAATYGGRVVGVLLFSSFKKCIEKLIVDPDFPEAEALMRETAEKRLI